MQYFVDGQEARGLKQNSMFIQGGASKTSRYPTGVGVAGKQWM